MLHSVCLVCALQVATACTSSLPWSVRHITITVLVSILTRISQSANSHCYKKSAAGYCRWNGGELDYNQDDARQTVINWIDGTEGLSSAFDFPTKGILQEAVKNCQYWRLRDQNGKAPGVLGWYPKRAVTFIDNHDTGVCAHLI